jgi:protein O-GlcNAc transferase
VFFQAGSEAVTRRIAARLQRALERRGVPPRGQLKFLPRMDAARFREVLALGHVVLDTVRWSGGNTSLDAFAAGAPVLTLPGRFMRGRQSFAMLREMDLDDLIARSHDEYVEKAVAIACDTPRREALRLAIAERNPRLFGQRPALDAFQEALLALAARAR